MTKADEYREYARMQRELAARRPDIAVSCRENAAQWDKAARRAEQADAQNKR